MSSISNSISNSSSSGGGFGGGSRSELGSTPLGEIVLFEGYSDELLTFAWVACIVFIIVGVPGNLLTIVALSRGKQTRNSTAIFIINLSCSDLLFGCFNLPLAASTFMERAWTHSVLLCRLFPLLRYALLAVSLLSVSLITINRYIIIAHPRQYPRIYQRRYLALMIAGIWLVTFSLMIPTWRGVWGRFGLDTSIGSCSILHDENDRSPKEFLFIAAFMLPCLCIVCCYARIFQLVRKAAIRTRERSGEPTKTPDLPPTPVVAPTPAPVQPPKSDAESSSSSSRPFIVYESLAYIDDNVSSDHLPISYTIKPETPLDARSVLQRASHSENHSPLANNKNSKAITKSPSLLDQANIANSNSNNNSNSNRNPITTSLRTSFTRFSPRKSHYVSMGNTSNASSIYPGRMSSKDRRLLKMILVIFVWFVICYLPITVAKIWKSATEVHVFNVMGYLLIYLTTCINPLIYVLMSSEYRRAYWNILRCHKTEQQQQLAQTKKKHMESNRLAKT